MRQPSQGADAAIGVAFAIAGAIAALFLSRAAQPSSPSAEILPAPAPAIQVPEVSIPEIQQFIPPLPSVQLPSLPVPPRSIELPPQPPTAPVPGLPRTNPTQWLKGFSGGLVGSVDLASMSPAELRDRIGARVYRMAAGCGSFPIAPDRIATALHCVSGQVEQFQTADGTQSFNGILIWSDPGSDAAVFQVSDVRLDPFPLAQATAGEPVWAIGYPGVMGGRLTVTPSQVMESELLLPGLRLQTPVILLPDGAYYPGNSGGPLLNRRGEVIGFAHAITENPPHYGFAIPSAALPR